MDDIAALLEQFGDTPATGNPNMLRYMNRARGVKSDPGMFESGLTIGSGMLAQPIAGWAGLLGLPAGADRAADITRQVQEMLTYQPRTERGNEDVKNFMTLMTPFQAAQEGMGHVGNALAGPLGGAAGEAAFAGATMLPLGRLSSAGRGNVPNALYRNQAGMVKGPGGMWVPGVEDTWGVTIRDRGAGQGANVPNTWGSDMVRKYLNKYAGTERDPLKDVVLPSGKKWEAVMDAAIGKTSKEQILRNTQGRGDNAWNTVLKDTPLKEDLWGVGMFPGSNRVAGPGMLATKEIDDYLSHVGDFLRQNVPKEKLSQYDLPRAVKETAANDARVAKEMEKVTQAMTAELPVYKEYPDKFKWVELTAPKKLTPEQAKGVRALPGKEWRKSPGGDDEMFPSQGGTHKYEALDSSGKPIRNSYTEELAGGSTPEEAWLAGRLAEEGNQLGHCVGGYCDDVMSGASTIYSLRDAKGRSHVTVEATPPAGLSGDMLISRGRMDLWDAYKKRNDYGPGSIGANRGKVDDGYGKGDDLHSFVKNADPAFYEELMSTPSIQQIKGKQNKAPNKEYLPYVQDFVKSGKWGEVGDMGNTGLFEFRGKGGTLYPQAALDEGLNNINPHDLKLAPGYYTEAELMQALRAAKKKQK